MVFGKEEHMNIRLEALRTAMKQEGVDGYLITSSDFHDSEYVHEHFKLRQYISGFTGSNGTLAVGQTWAGLWTDGRYFVQAERQLEGSGITLFRMLEEGVPDLPDFLYEQMEEGQVLAFDGRTISCREGQRLEKRLKEKKIRLADGLDLGEQIWADRPPLPCHPVTSLSEAVSGKPVREKLQEVREAMKQAGAAYLLSARLDDIMWLLNLRGSDVAYLPVALAYCFLTMEEVYLFLQPEAVTGELEQELGEQGILLRPYEEIGSFLEHYDYKGKALLDPARLSYSLFHMVEERTEIVSGCNPAEELKAVKNPVELAHMKEVYLKDSLQVTRFIYWLKQQIGRQTLTEVTAGAYLDGLREQTEGFLELSFPTICAYEEHAAMMHYQAEPESCKQLEARGMLLVDSGGQYVGGTTDVTRTIVLGEISPEIRAQYTRVVMGMLRLSNARFLQGCTGRNLDILARQPLWEIGMDYKCGTGHGIGYMLSVHEGPQGIRWRYTPGVREAVLQPGMAVSNEPGVYVEGSHGIRIENILVVQEEEKNGDGQFLSFDTLTYVPIDREAVDPSLMQPSDLDLLNRYHAQVYQRLAPYLTPEERAWLAEATAPMGALAYRRKNE